jgi:hypothetical protein
MRTQFASYDTNLIKSNFFVPLTLHSPLIYKVHIVGCELSSHSRIQIVFISQLLLFTHSNPTLWGGTNWKVGGACKTQEERKEKFILKISKVISSFLGLVIPVLSFGFHTSTLLRVFTKIWQRSVYVQLKLLNEWMIK